MATHEIEERDLENENEYDSQVSVSPGTKERNAGSFVVGLIFHGLASAGWVEARARH